MPSKLTWKQIAALSPPVRQITTFLSFLVFPSLFRSPIHPFLLRISLWFVVISTSRSIRSPLSILLYLLCFGCCAPLYLFLASSLFLQTVRMNSKHTTVRPTRRMHRLNFRKLFAWIAKHFAARVPAVSADN